jgi:hypothetical protein
MPRDTASATIKIEGRDDYEATITENWDRQQGLTIHSLQMPDQVAATALQMIERWGCIAAVPDGEDRAGRSRLRLQTPDELATYAFKAAEAFWAKAHELGHVLALPSAEERRRLLDDARKAEDGN